MKRSLFVGVVYLISLLVSGIPHAALAAAADTIANPAVPATVAKLFQEAYGRPITATESTYWKQRARTDKKTISALRGALQFQKGKNNSSAQPVGKAAASVVCTRTTPYPLAPELKAALAVVKKTLLAHEPGKSHLPLKQFENCLNIRFAEDAAAPEAWAAFWWNKSSPTDLRITIAPRLKGSGHVILGQNLSHEMMHAWQFVQSTQKKKKNPAFASYKPLSCYAKEAEAIWMEISYLRSLRAKNDQKLEALLADARESIYTETEGAYHNWNLLRIADEHAEDMKKNPISTLSHVYVQEQDFFRAQCG